MSEIHSSSRDCSSCQGGIGAFFKILLGIIFFSFLTGLVLCKYRMNHPTYDQSRATERSKKLADLRAKEAAILGSYAVIDEAKGIYQIPIARAMELEIESLQSKPIRAAGVIPLK